MVKNSLSASEHSVKTVVLKFGAGSLTTGFATVVAELFQNTTYLSQFRGSLPPASELAELQQHWQALYAGLVRRLPSRIEIVQRGVTQVSEPEFLQLDQMLTQQFQTWLAAEGFQAIERKLRVQLNPADTVQILLESDNNALCRLPWHSWNFLEDYPRSEVALSWPERLTPHPMRAADGKVRVLAVLGDSRGIDIEADFEQLSHLPNIELVLLKEPTPDALHDQLWDSRGFDIFFFAGHSYTWSSQGQMRLSDIQTLSLARLSNALKHAISRGLQLAIFNSCDGLGFAHELANWQLPQSVVMREPVPEPVAQAFLKNLLTQFAQGQPLHLAVRSARERIQGLEEAFPAASSLPILSQASLAASLTWTELREKRRQDPEISQPVDDASSPASNRPGWQRLLVSSLVGTGVVLGLRWLGLLQPFELGAFDLMTQQLPVEQADPRLLVVAIDEQDISLEGYGHPLSDGTIAELITTLDAYGPSAIGLDIVRDQAINPGHSRFVSLLQESERLVTPCAFAETKQDSIAPPPQSPDFQVGFVDLFNDASFTPTDYTVRRYLLTRNENPIETMSKCESPYSFGWQLAYRYFLDRDIDVVSTEKSWQFGALTVPLLQRRSGGYHTLDDRGSQTLIRYRRTADPRQLAQQVTLREVLGEEATLKPEWVEGRVVLIGIVAASDRDTHDTPVGRLSGVYVHAHLVSQLLSAVEDGRRLSRWLPEWKEVCIVVLIGIVGGGVSLLPVRSGLRWLAAGGGCVAIYGGSWLALLFGLWLPWVPASLALLASTSIGQGIRKNK